MVWLGSKPCAWRIETELKSGFSALPTGRLVGLPLFRGAMARLKAFFTYVFLTLVCLGTGAVLPVNSAEDTGRPGTEIKPDHSKPAEQVYKNIQVLKGIPSDELIQIGRASCRERE